MKDTAARRKVTQWLNETDQQLFDRNICLGADGSEIHDGERAGAEEEARIEVVDYFHGLHEGVAICQTWEEERDVLATEMVSAIKGRIVRACTTIHKKIRQHAEKVRRIKEKRPSKKQKADMGTTYGATIAAERTDKGQELMMIKGIWKVTTKLKPKKNSVSTEG